MSKKSFILSSAGLKNLNLNQNQNYVDEFKFIIGEQEIKMRNIFAEFISPYVSQIHQSDPTIDSINLINTKSNHLTKISNEIISLFKLLSKGDSIEIDSTQCFELQILSILLKNEELFLKLDSLFPQDNNENDKNDANKINEILEFISFLDMNTENQYFISGSKSIKYIASKLYSIDPKKIKTLPKSIFYSILTNDELTLESEDSLLDLIEEFFNENEKKNEKEAIIDNNNKKSLSKIDFYEEINFDYLSESKFKEFIDEFDPNEMTTTLWNKIKKCFYIYKNSTSTSKIDSNTKLHHYIRKGRLIEYDDNKEHAFKGIIHELTKECGGNVEDKGYVKITSSSIHSDSYLPKNAADLDNNTNYFLSLNNENSWLQYDFMKRKVIPTHYSIRSRHDNGKNGHHPKNWVIEGSNDNNKWTNLDTRQNDDFLNDKSAIHTFDIKNTSENKEGFRYLRIRYIGPNWYGNYYYMVISALEFFGRLIEQTSN